jgi:ABC-2 type transport system permease protein
MSRHVSRPAILAALFKKELTAYRRDTLYIFLTVLTLVAVVVLYQFLPDSVNEEITFAVTPPVDTLAEDARDTLVSLGATEEQLAELDEVDFTEGEEGIAVVEFESEEDMTSVVEGEIEAWQAEDGTLILRDREGGDEKPDDAEKLSIDIGIAFPETFITDVALGEDTVKVTVYSDANVPEEIQGAMEGFVRETGYALAGQEMPVEFDEEAVILGEDRVGDQVTLQEKFRPMIVFMILLMETFSLSSLISTEVLQRTVTAVLVTPVRIGDFLSSKTIFGTMLGLTQGYLVLLLVGGLTAENWSLLLVVVLMGAVMFTGVAMITGAAGKDFMGQLFYNMIFIVPMIIPAFAALFPGTVATWVQVIPTYPIMEVLVGATSYDMGWSDAAGYLLYAAAWLVALYLIGLFTLKRKVESL